MKRLIVMGLVASVILPISAIAQRDIACTITATPSRAAPGESITLHWGSQNARSANLTGYGPVPLQGSRVVQATQTTDYKILVSGYENNYVGCIARITVTSKQPTCQISLVPFAVASNSFATLSWATEFADTVYISGIGSVHAKGNTMVRATGNSTYTISARGVGGVCERSASLSITNPYQAYGYFPSTIQSVTYPLFGYSAPSNQPMYSYQPRYGNTTSVTDDGYKFYSADATYDDYKYYDSWDNKYDNSFNDWYKSDEVYKGETYDTWKYDFEYKSPDTDYELKNDSGDIDTSQNYWQSPSPNVGDCWEDVCSI